MGTIVVALIVAAAVIAIIVRLVKGKKRGASCCGCDCCRAGKGCGRGVE